MSYWKIVALIVAAMLIADLCRSISDLRLADDIWDVLIMLALLIADIVITAGLISWGFPPL